jgi:hypothetical protein
MSSDGGAVGRKKTDSGFDASKPNAIMRDGEWIDAINAYAVDDQ